MDVESSDRSRINWWVWVQLVSLGFQNTDIYLHLVDVSLTGGFWINFVSWGLTDRFGLSNMGQCHFVDLSFNCLVWVQLVSFGLTDRFGFTIMGLGSFSRCIFN